MSTSGVYRALEDVTRTHDDCGWEGDVLGSRDDEDLSLWWQCPGCGATITEHREDDYDDRGAAQPLFILLVVGFALVVIGILGHWVWPLIIGGAWLIALAYMIRSFIGAAQQGDNDHE